MMRLKSIFSLILILALISCLIYLVFSRTQEGQLEEPVLSTPVFGADPVASAPEPTPTPTQELTFTPEPVPILPVIDLQSWEYRLVNKENLLESDFEISLTEVDGGRFFDARATKYLNDFLAAARAEGYNTILLSTYRTYETQQYLFNRKLQEKQNSGLSYDDAYAAASRIVAIPGSSEHQLGLACDIVDKHYEYLNESLADTPLLKWMKEHCAEYGFILRYPEDKQDITGIMYEPWHFRYVGTNAARFIMENGLCLEEFIHLYSSEANSDYWIQKPSADAVEAVKSIIENQLKKDYTITVRVDEVSIDEKETQRQIVNYTGSELAEHKGWTDNYLSQNFLAVRAKYYVEYDHIKTFLVDGDIDQYFYMVRDTDTGLWSVFDNSTSGMPESQK